MIRHRQAHRYDSPWSIRQKASMLLWQVCWALFCRWTPKPMNRWRIQWLKAFGASIRGRPFVHQHAVVTIPWNLTLGDHACLGDGAVAYTLGKIEVKDHATVAQEAYLCTGTHDFSSEARELMTSPIIVEEHAFIGARAFVMPGVSIGRDSVIGAMSVVTRDVPPKEVWVGNPARCLSKKRGGTV